MDTQSEYYFIVPLGAKVRDSVERTTLVANAAC